MTDKLRQVTPTPNRARSLYKKHLEGLVIDTYEYDRLCSKLMESREMEDAVKATLANDLLMVWVRPSYEEFNSFNIPLWKAIESDFMLHTKLSKEAWKDAICSLIDGYDCFGDYYEETFPKLMQRINQSLKAWAMRRGKDSYSLHDLKWEDLEEIVSWMGDAWEAEVSIKVNRLEAEVARLTP
jgi:hypothetical protein